MMSRTGLNDRGPKDMGKFNGKTALVTGGGAGIGRATALAFAREGASVVVGNRNADRGEETVRLIEQAGGQAVFRRTDVTVPADVAALVALAVAEFGSLDCAFNNAGIMTGLALIEDQSEDEFDRVIETNVKGVWLAMKHELKQMLAQGHGTIVNNSSVGGITGSGRGTANYTASKHAVLGLTKCAALENARRGIRVNAIAPYVIETDMGSQFASELKIAIADFARMNPMGRVGTVEDAAAAVLWLCSDEASFLTAHTLTIDGGYTAQ
jgi:NAD(P)-dependent dehydrogenase (short-subunit alcohol dehydrogenase family)